MQALAAKPIGTGTLEVRPVGATSGSCSRANPDYWQGAPELNRVTFRYIPEFSARLAALLAGEVDIMKDVPPHAVDLVDRSGKAKVRATVPPASTTWPW